MTSPKFRIWNKKRQAWHRKEVTLFGDIILTGELLRSEIDGKVIGLEELEDLVVMQYTGLQDSKGVDLYVSDIVHISGRISGPDGPITAEVIFKDGAFVADPKIPIGVVNVAELLAVTAVDVVGNVYENSDMLEAL
jgi:uncharacterized phage protein (TIGR01671 family)